MKNLDITYLPRKFKQEPRNDKNRRKWKSTNEIFKILTKDIKKAGLLKARVVTYNTPVKSLFKWPTEKGRIEG